jgi:hypothetical protein
MFLCGLTKSAPTACVLGTVGLALVAEGISNAGIEDITHLPQKAADTLGLSGQVKRQGQPVRVAL